MSELEKRIANLADQMTRTNPSHRAINKCLKNIAKDFNIPEKEVRRKFESHTLKEFALK